MKVLQIMSNWLDALKDSIPDYAKDIKLNLDSIIKQSTLEQEQTKGCALACAFATNNKNLVAIISNAMLDETEKTAALTAAALMAQNNTWYPYTEMVEGNLKGISPQLRMNAIATHGGTTKLKFESYSLAASIIGKCEACVKSHFNTLKNEGYTTENLRDIGRIAATIAAVAKLLP
jgi:alkyl hydroperoxide reductase subunit D